MKLAVLAAATCVAVTMNAEAARIGGAPRAAVRVPGAVHVHPAHVHGGVAVGVGFGVGFGYWPNAWPGYYYPPAYYAPPPVYYAPPPPPVSYWYYCPQAGAYYPYTPSCPGPWQLVAPTPYTN